MSQMLEIPDQVYAALVEAATAQGKSPADLIAGLLPEITKQNSPSSSAPVAGSAPTPGDPFADSSSSDVDDQDGADMDRPWRGVFAPEYEREVLFTQEMTIRTADLPRWEPQVTIDPRWIPEDEP
jgi:hypothetical protein